MKRGQAACPAGGRARLLQLDRVKAIAVAALLPLPLRKGARHVVTDDVDVVAHARLRGAHLIRGWRGMEAGVALLRGCSACAGCAARTVPACHGKGV